jgi:hypothetical protein
MVALAVLLLPLAATQSNYCSITKEHTMCKHKVSAKTFTFFFIASFLH